MLRFVLISAAIGFGLATTGCDQAQTEKNDSKASDAPQQPAQPKLTELKIEDVKVGEGVAPKVGDLVLVDYEGKLADGTVFDSSERTGGFPLAFRLGAGDVIKGWDQGVQGMKVGGERKLSIPSNLAYGERSTGTIPANSDLFFTVELLDVVPKGQEGDYNIDDVKKGTGREAKAGDTVEVHYTGTFVNGKKFDSSKDRGQPFSFTLGKGDVIKGWDLGVVGMRVGGVRKLRIPPALAYGPGGSGPVGANQVLLFEVELLGIK